MKNLIEQIQNICTEHKVKGTVTDLITAAVLSAAASKPKNTVTHRVTDGVDEYFCRYTLAWYTRDQMVFSNGKSKGYSKVGISLWNKQNKLVKTIESKIAAAAIKGELNQELIDELAEARGNLNNPEYYVSLLG